MRNDFSLPPAIERILDAARWAPSGDNAQPWTFAVDGDNDITVWIHPEAGNVYEYRDGEPTLISAGTLLENIAIAAPSFGKRAEWQYLGMTEGAHRIAVRFQDAPVAQHPLFSQIWQRSVDRRPYRMRPLPHESKALLAQSVDGDISLEWFEALASRRRVAALANLATDIRLRIPETFAIHRRIVDWTRLLSPHGIPSRALGLDRMTLKIMRWSMADWKRMDFGNRLGSAMFAGLQMDILPGLFSAAYFALRLRGAAGGEDRARQLLRAGQTVQRFWLTATKLGLAMQPCQAVLAFTHYGATGEPFTVSERMRPAAARLARNAAAVFSSPQELVFLARIGWPRTRKLESRSTRLPLSTRMHDSRAPV